MTFDKAAHMIKVQGGRFYLPVSARILWFRDTHPDYRIHTEIVQIDHDQHWAIFRAKIADAAGNILATGTKKEDAKGFGDYIEKAETGSVGRALHFLGFGTDGDDGSELDAGRPVDSPQSQRQPMQQPRQPAEQPRQQAPAPQSANQGQGAQKAKPDAQGESVPAASAADVAADYRRKAANVFGRWDSDIQAEWGVYIRETYHADSIESVADKYSHALWQEIIEAQKEAAAVAAQKKAAAAPGEAKQKEPAAAANP